MTQINIAGFWSIFMPLAVAGLGAVAAWATKLLARSLKLNAGSQALDDFDQAMAHGLALAEDTLQSVAAHNGTIDVPSALAQAARLVLTLAPAAVSALGITPAAVAALITSKLSPEAAARAKAAAATTTVTNAS